MSQYNWKTDRNNSGRIMYQYEVAFLLFLLERLDVMTLGELDLDNHTTFWHQTWKLSKFSYRSPFSL